MFIFKMALADDYDFGAQIKIVSYLFAVVGALAVEFVVNWRLAKKIGKIDMVSSLKGNEQVIVFFDYSIKGDGSKI